MERDQYDMARKKRRDKARAVGDVGLGAISHQQSVHDLGDQLGVPSNDFAQEEWDARDFHSTRGGDSRRISQEEWDTGGFHSTRGGDSRRTSQEEWDTGDFYSTRGGDSRRISQEEWDARGFHSTRGGDSRDISQEGVLASDQHSPRQVHNKDFGYPDPPEDAPTRYRSYTARHTRPSRLYRRGQLAPSRRQSQTNLQADDGLARDSSQQSFAPLERRPQGNDLCKMLTVSIFDTPRSPDQPPRHEVYPPSPTADTGLVARYVSPTLENLRSFSPMDTQGVSSVTQGAKAGPDNSYPFAWMMNMFFTSGATTSATQSMDPPRADGSEQFTDGFDAYSLSTNKHTVFSSRTGVLPAAVRGRDVHVAKQLSSNSSASRSSYSESVVPTTPQRVYVPEIDMNRALSIRQRHTSAEPEPSRQMEGPFEYGESSDTTNSDAEFQRGLFVDPEGQSEYGSRLSSHSPVSTPPLWDREGARDRRGPGREQMSKRKEKLVRGHPPEPSLLEAEQTRMSATAGTTTLQSQRSKEACDLTEVQNELRAHRGTRSPLSASEDELPPGWTQALSSSGVMLMQSDEDEALASVGDKSPWRAWKTSNLQLGLDYGFGYGLYYVTLEMLCVGFTVMALCQTFGLVCNLSTDAKLGRADFVRDSTLFSMLMVFSERCCSYIGGMDAKQALTAIAVLDGIGSIMFAKLIHMSGEYLNKQSEKMDFASFTLGDYALIVKNLPNVGTTDFPDEECLKADLVNHFITLTNDLALLDEEGTDYHNQGNEGVPSRALSKKQHDKVSRSIRRNSRKFLGGELPNSVRAEDPESSSSSDKSKVFEVVLASEHTSLMEPHRRKNQLVSEIKALQIQGVLPDQRWRTRLWKIPLNVADRCYMPFLVPPGVRLALKTHELLCIKNMIEETLEETCESTAIRCAFVVLNNEADRLRVLRYGTKQPFMGDLTITVGEAPEPDGLMWEHLHATTKQRRRAALRVHFMLFVGLLFSTVFMIWFNWQAQRQFDLQVNCHTVQSGFLQGQDMQGLSCDIVMPASDIKRMLKEQAQGLNETRSVASVLAQFRETDWTTCNGDFLVSGVFQGWDGSPEVAVVQQQLHRRTWDNDLMAALEGLGEMGQCAAAVCYYCYCWENIGAWDLIFGSSNYEFCFEFMENVGQMYSNFAAQAIMISVLNLALFPLLEVLTLKERHPVISIHMRAYAFKMLGSFLIINGLLPVLINMQVPGVLSSIFGGYIQDFDYSWYDKTGVAFLYNYFMNMVVIWPMREPGMFVSTWMLFWFVKRFEPVKEDSCKHCFSSLTDCACSKEDEHVFECSKDVLERFLNALVNSNWPESKEQVLPTQQQYRRLYEGAIYQYMFQDSLVSKWMLERTDWNTRAFVSEDACWRCFQSLQLRDAAGGTMCNESPAFEASMCDFVDYLRICDWPIISSRPDNTLESVTVTKSKIRKLLEGMLSFYTDDEALFPGLKQFVEKYLESKENKRAGAKVVESATAGMTDERRLSILIGLPAALRAEIRRHLNKETLSEKPVVKRQRLLTFELPTRYGKLLSSVFLASFFSTGMPIVQWLALFSTVFQWFADRFMLCHICKVSVRMGNEGAKGVVQLLLFAVFVHSCMGSWMLGSLDLPSFHIVPDSSADDVGKRYNQLNSLPHLVSASYALFLISSLVHKSYKRSKTKHKHGESIILESENNPDLSLIYTNADRYFADSTRRLFSELSPDHQEDLLLRKNVHLRRKNVSTGISFHNDIEDESRKFYGLLSYEIKFNPVYQDYLPITPSHPVPW